MKRRSLNTQHIATGRRFAVLAVVAAMLPAFGGSSAAFGQFVALSWDGGMYSIDETTGGMSTLGLGLGANLSSMGKDASGTLYCVRGNSLFEVDPTGAGIVEVQHLTTPFDARGVAVGPDGLLYVAKNAGNTDFSDVLYTVNITTGAVTEIGETGVLGLQALEFGPDGTLYSWEVGNGLGMGLVTIDLITAAVTDVDPLVDGMTNLQTLAFRPGRHALWCQRPALERGFRYGGSDGDRRRDNKRYKRHGLGAGTGDAGAARAGRYGN